MQILTKEYKVPFGYEGIFHTVARHRRSYYLTENKKNMDSLAEIRGRGRM